MRKTRINSSSLQYRILIIDDEIGIVNSVAIILKRNGYHCDGVTDPLAGIELLKKEHYDILILDYLMQNIHGDEVIKMVREFDPDLYIILLTGHKDLAPPLLTIKAFEIQAYCEKSDKFDQLILMVESARKSIMQMRTIRRFNDSLNAIIKSMSSIYQIKPVEDIIEEILLEIRSIAECDNGFILVYQNSDIQMLSNNIFKGMGTYNKTLDTFIQEDYPSLQHQLDDARTKNGVIKTDSGILLPLANEYLNSLGVLYLEGDSYIDCQKILEIYSSQVTAALNNSLLHSLVNSKNEEISKAYNEIDSLFKILEKNYRHQIDKNDFLEQVVKNRTAAIRNLLDNAGQGFLSFGHDLSIDSEYSLECTKIFGRKIENERFSLLLMPDDEDNIKLIDEAFVKILAEKDPAKRDAYMSLLPDAVEINGRDIHLEYKFINSSTNENLKKVMVILTDYTEKRQLEIQMEEERRVLKMVVKVVTNHEVFLDCQDEYNRFCGEKVIKLLNMKKPLEYIALEIYRQIHTFKGTFANFGIMNSVSRLQNYENKMYEFKKDLNNKSIDDLKNLMIGFDMSTALSNDLEVLQEVLGDKFLNSKGKVNIEKDKLIEIEDKMQSLLSKEESEVFIPLIKKLRYRPFENLMSTYPEYVLRMTERYGKKVYPFVIECEQILVDTDIFGDFARSLIHVFRNIVSHAIEYPEDRVAAGKDSSGYVECSIKSLDNSIEVVISDDGKGIDVNEIKDRAVKNGICLNSDIQEFNDKEILRLIFEDEITTREEVDEISGRGLGLSAVKSELDKLKGKAEIRTVKGEGTEFRFIIPLP